MLSIEESAVHYTNKFLKEMRNENFLVAIIVAQMMARAILKNADDNFILKKGFFVTAFETFDLTDDEKREIITALTSSI